MPSLFCTNCSERMHRDGANNSFECFLIKVGANSLEEKRTASICPKCKTMHVFKPNSTELEEVYVIDGTWRERAANSKKSCGCIVVKDGKVLLIQAKNDKGKLFWAFPKGKQEPGENDQDTAIRETKEEIGLDVEIIDDKPIMVGRLVHDGAAYNKIFLFIARPLNNTLKIRPREVKQAKWVPINDAGKYLDGLYGDAWEELLNRSSNN